MKLYCMVNSLKEEGVEGYKHYHETAHQTEWKSQIEALKQAGAQVCNVYLWNGYSIVIMGCEDLDACLAKLAENPENQKWQQLMSGFFQANPKFDGSETQTVLKIFDMNEQAQGFLDQD